MLIALAVGSVVMFAGCGPSSISPEEAWLELAADQAGTSAGGLEHKLELASTVLTAGVDQAGRPLVVPLGLAELVQALANDESSDSLRREFENSLEGLGDWVAAMVEMDRASVRSGTRTVLRQTIELSSAKTRNGVEEPSAVRYLWVPRRVPGFIEQLHFDGTGKETSFLLRVVDGEGEIRPVQGRSLRAGGVGPPGTLFEIPTGSRRIELIYGRIEPRTGARGLLMPVVAERVRLPIWLGRSESALFPQSTPSLEVLAGLRAGVMLTVPSIVAVAEEFTIDVQFTDAFGNATRGRHSAFEVSLGGTVVSRFGSGKGSNLRIGDIGVVTPGVVRFRLVSSEGLVAWSNPVLVVSEPPGRVHWTGRAAAGEPGGGPISGRGLIAAWGFASDSTLQQTVGNPGVYTTSGARILARCVGPEGPRSARCLFNGTAPIARVRIMSGPVGNEAVVLRDESLLAGSSADGLLALRWNLEGNPKSVAVYGDVAQEGVWRGTLTASHGEFSSAVLHGQEVARHGAKPRIFKFEVISGRNGGLVIQGKGIEAGRLAVELTHQRFMRSDGARESGPAAILDLRALPQRLATSWGFIEASWLKEDPVLDLDLQWPKLSAKDLKLAWAVVEQVDGQTATVPFAANLFGGLEPQ